MRMTATLSPKVGFKSWRDGVSLRCALVHSLVMPLWRCSHTVAPIVTAGLVILASNLFLHH